MKFSLTILICGSVVRPRLVRNGSLAQYVGGDAHVSDYEHKPGAVEGLLNVGDQDTYDEVGKADGPEQPTAAVEAPQQALAIEALPQDQVMRFYPNSPKRYGTV